MPRSALLPPALVALAVSALATAVLRSASSRLGLVDRSNARSLHEGEVPRGGGLGLLLGVAAGLGVASAGAGVAISGGAAALLLGGLLLALVGLADDRWRLSPALRLVAHAVAALLVVRAAGGVPSLPLPAPLALEIGPLGGALGVVWIVAVVNFYNFLDGIDGLAGLQAVATGLGIALAGWDRFGAALGACVAAAALGFLLHNWSPARIFMGDAGSGALGFCLAAAPFLAPPGARPAALYLVALSLFLFLADATFTLLRRWRRGRRLHEAHREHLYQRLVAGGFSHARVAALIGAVGFLLTGLALLGWWRGDAVWSWLGLGAAALAFGAEILLAARAREPRELTGTTAGARA